MERKDWALLVIASARGEPVSPVQLQKALFLIGQGLSDELRKTKGFYNFEPYHYGPFCTDVYHDADELAMEGLVSIRRDASYRVYLATPLGLNRADTLRAVLDSAARDYLDRVVAWVRQKSFMGLIRSIYEAYPAMKARSVFQS